VLVLTVLCYFIKLCLKDKTREKPAVPPTNYFSFSMANF